MKALKKHIIDIACSIIIIIIVIILIIIIHQYHLGTIKPSRSVLTSLGPALPTGSCLKALDFFLPFLALPMLSHVKHQTQGWWWLGRHPSQPHIMHHHHHHLQQSHEYRIGSDTTPSAQESIQLWRSL